MLKPRISGQRGFTLIELMTVTSIIGVLAGVALSSFSSYQATARDQEAQILLRSIIVAEEAYFTQSNSYVTCDETDCATFFPEIGQMPPDVDVQFTSVGSSCFATVSHNKGTGKVFTWSS